jgi:hypothetical protein
MESQEKGNIPSSDKQPDNKQNVEGDGFEISEIAKTSEQMEKMKLEETTPNSDSKEPTKLNADSKEFKKPEKAKLANSGRVFKPKGKPKEEGKSKLENKGKTFKPSASQEEAKYADDPYDQYQGFEEGVPEYLEETPDLDEVEDDFLRFQQENDQIEAITEVIGEFGENLIRFEESSRNCECCQGLVERCDGEICETLGECYCVSHNRNKDKS